jgi:hypothetical protein
MVTHADRHRRGKNTRGIQFVSVGVAINPHTTHNTAAD